MVRPGFAEPWVGRMLPSQTKRFGISCVRPNLSTTEVDGSLPIRVAPTKWAKRDSCTTCFAPAAHMISITLFFPNSINFLSLS